MKTFFKSFIIVLVFFVLSFQLVMMKYNKNTQPRDPASVNNDLTSYSGSRLTEEIKKAVLSDLVIEFQDPWVFLTLGHFRFVDVDGQIKWGCESYEKMNLKFEADSAVDGQLTEMTIEAKCFYQEGEKEVVPIKVPLKQILTEYEPTDGEINFNYEVPVSLTFKNLPGAFPKKWYLSQIQFIKSSGNVFEINKADLANYSKQLNIEL